MSKSITEALNYIHSTSRFGSVLGLDNITKLLDLMGNPQNNLKFIHIAGTNGKGSTSSYIMKILEEAGYRVGFFTSPYIETFNERIRINENYISDEDVVKTAFMVKEKVDKMLEENYNHPTEFEVVTAMAMEYFKYQKVDFVVLEVGMGGRYDSTNVIDSSIASIITPIGMDHTEILGDTLEKIAYEKAGIIKEKGLVIYAEQDKEAETVIEDVSRKINTKTIKSYEKDIDILKLDESGSKFDIKVFDYKLKNLEIKMLGKHQVSNASLAIKTIYSLKDRNIIDVSEKNVYDGLLNTRWIGRLELISENPKFLIDGAHNKQGIEALKLAIEGLFKYNRLIMGIGILADKDVDDMIKDIIPVGDKIIVTEPTLPRAMKAVELGEKIKKINEDVEIIANMDKAVERAIEIAKEGDLILFLGSLYLIGDIRKIAKKKLN